MNRDYEEALLNAGSAASYGYLQNEEEIIDEITDSKSCVVDKSDLLKLINSSRLEVNDLIKRREAGDRLFRNNTEAELKRKQKRIRHLESLHESGEIIYDNSRLSKLFNDRLRKEMINLSLGHHEVELQVGSAEFIKSESSSSIFILEIDGMTVMDVYVSTSKMIEYVSLIIRNIFWLIHRVDSYKNSLKIECESFITQEIDPRLFEL